MFKSSLVLPELYFGAQAEEGSVSETGPVAPLPYARGSDYNRASLRVSDGAWKGEGSTVPVPRLPYS